MLEKEVMTDSNRRDRNVTAKGDKTEFRLKFKLEEDFQRQKENLNLQMTVETCRCVM